MKYKRLYLVHIPRTGGSALVKSILKHENKKKFYSTCSHKSALTGSDKDGWNNKIGGSCYLKHYIYKDQTTLNFAIVRNPFDMLASFYFYKFPYPNGEWDKKIFDVNKYPYKSFGDFIKAFCSNDLCLLPNMDPLRKNLFFQLFKSDGDPAVKCVIRYEHFKEGIKRLCRVVGIEPMNLDYKYNTSSTDRLPYGKKHGYRYYYNDELIDIVTEHCKIELEMFGYGFNDAVDKRVIINIKNEKYIYSTNQMISL